MAGPTMPDESVSPVESIPGDEPSDLQPGIALCLSGGGYRAMLFHLGTLWRLNHAAYLTKLNRVSSVSGGSITAGMLGLAWSKLSFDENQVAQNFDQEVVRPLRRLASKTIDVKSALFGIFGPGTSSDHVARAYEKYLFGQSDLQQLPKEGEGPRFVINATNLQSGKLWRFSQPYAWDYRVGKITEPEIKVAVAVAASSAFPPVLSPMVLRFNDSDYEPNSGKDLQRPPFTTEVYLTDGGVYDNLGLETAWKRCMTILVSDGGARMREENEPNRDFLRHTLRVLTLIDSQVRSRRYIQIFDSFNLPPGHQGHRDGAYWSTYRDIKEYGVADPLPCPYLKTVKLAAVPTRLASMSDTLQKQLINWGYAACDAAMRAFDSTIPTHKGFPYSDVGVG
jgi:NTE family protein